MLLQLTTQSVACATDRDAVVVRLPPVARGVLHLPVSPGYTEFLCRKCYGLYYRSQMCDLDFILRPLAAEAYVPKRIARRFLEGIGRFAMAGLRQ